MRSNDRSLRQKSAGSWGMLSIIFRVLQRYEPASKALPLTQGRAGGMDSHHTPAML